MLAEAGIQEWQKRPGFPPSREWHAGWIWNFV